MLAGFLAGMPMLLQICRSAYLQHMGAQRTAHPIHDVQRHAQVTRYVYYDVESSDADLTLVHACWLPCGHADVVAGMPIGIPATHGSSTHHAPHPRCPTACSSHSISYLCFSCFSRLICHRTFNISDV